MHNYTVFIIAQLFNDILFRIVIYSGYSGNHEYRGVVCFVRLIIMNKQSLIIPDLEEIARIFIGNNWFVRFHSFFDIKH